jgi:hypothetical protein
MKLMASTCRALVLLLVLGLGAGGVTGAWASPAQAVASPVLWSSPDGHGGACALRAPCSLATAQETVRTLEVRKNRPDVTVELLAGTYRLSKPWTFGAADSGREGHPVVWKAAPSAHPVVSGATRVTGWSRGRDGVWSADVPRGSESRQLYVDGVEAPIAQAGVPALRFTGGWTGSATGYDLSDDQAALAWFGRLTPAEVARVEFDYPAGNGAWTDSKCRVAKLSGTRLVMAQPCWKNVTDAAPFTDGTGGLPSMPTSQMPSTIQDARDLLGAGQWFLDGAGGKLYYAPKNGRSMAGLDVELPRLQTLLQAAGSLSEPVHDITFSGLQFSHATWNAPSSPAGFADVQSNLHRTGENNQGLCTFSTPPGSCPWGALSEPAANVAFTASSRITITGDRFVDLGGAGLSFKYGGSGNRIEGNEFTQIASTALYLGCAYDPTPTTTPASVIKSGCAASPNAVASDRVGRNEILDHTTVANNVIHKVGTDYRSACGITLLFSQHTTITHNDLYDLPYTGITAGVVEGHVDDANHPQNSTNINADNTISHNLIFDVMQVLDDGGGIYMEGHQAEYVYKADGALDPAATLANGLHVTGNVVYNDGSRFNAYYDDAGSEWINFSGNAEFHALTSLGAQGGCSATGHFWVSGNFFSDDAGSYICTAPIDSNVGDHSRIPASPGPEDIPDALLAHAGVTGSYASFTRGGQPEAHYVSSPTPITAGSTTNQVLIGGAHFSPSTPVHFGDRRATRVRALSSGFLIAQVPAGADGTDVTVGTYVPRPAITAPDDGTVGLGDHYAVRGTAEAGNTVAVADSSGKGGCTVSAGTDGGWTCTLTNSTPGQHTLTATQSDRSGAMSKPTAGTTVYVGTPPATARLDDTDAAISYTGWDFLDGRGFGDYNDDLHYTQNNGSSLSCTFIGTGIKVFAEQYTDQGDIGVSIDGAPATIVSTVPADGTRHANVPVYSSTRLTPGAHQITVTKLSGSYATFDGLEIDNPSA